jgi:predicted dehydrogenase
MTDIRYPHGMWTRRQTLITAAALPATLFSASVKPRLRYLQIGTGHPHADKIGVYRASDDWKVVGVVEPDETLRKTAMSKELYAGLPFMSLEEGLATPELAAVGIETRVRDLLHYAHIALDAGCYLHLDKPAGASWVNYQALMEKAEAARLVVQMGYMYRFNPAVVLLRRMIQEGWLGEIFEVHAVMSKVIPQEQRMELAEFAGGVMFELGGHIIDLVIGILGKPEAVRAFPRQTQTTGGDTFRDNMLAVLEYPRALATVKSSGLEVDGGARRHLLVCGTEGTAQIQPLDRPELKLTLSRERRFDGDTTVYKKGTQTIPFEPPYQRYVGDAANLASIIRGELPNMFPSSHDLAVQETVLRASAMWDAV